MEELRSVTIKVEVDTNKDTYTKTFTLDDGDADEILVDAVIWTRSMIDD